MVRAPGFRAMCGTGTRSSWWLSGRGLICLRTGAVERWPCRLLDGVGRRLTAVAPTNTAPTEAAQCGREELGDVSFDAGSQAGHVWEVAIVVGWRRLCEFWVGHAVTRDPPVRRGRSGGIRP